MSLLSTFVRYWKSENKSQDILRSDVDLIVPISYTTLRDGLTEATKRNMEIAISEKIERSSSSIRLAFSSCSYPFKGAEIVEDKLRSEMCRQVVIYPILARPMVNTVDEAFNVRDALNERGLKPKCILIITGELHSRSARYVWKKLFPEARILIRCIPYSLEIQPDHIVLDQRQMGKWVLSNVKREIALRLLPLSFVRKFQHKPAEQFLDGWFRQPFIKMGERFFNNSHASSTYSRNKFSCLCNTPNPSSPSA